MPLRRSGAYVDAFVDRLRSRALWSLIAILLLGVGSNAVGKDTLGDFEKAARKSGGDSGPSTQGNDGSGLGVLALPYLIFESVGATHDLYSRRSPGTPSTALLRLETTYQPLSNADVHGYTFRSELVWSFVGVGAEFINYRESSPKQTFDFLTLEGLFRFVPNERIRLTLAAGARRLEGKRDTSRPQAGISVGLYPVDWLGVEIDLRWADLGGNTLGDYRIGGLLRFPNFPIIGLRMGYRTIQVGDETLHGGEVGAVFTW
jgi:hypothetical protein